MIEEREGNTIRRLVLNDAKAEPPVNVVTLTSWGRRVVYIGDIIIDPARTPRLLGIRRNDEAARAAVARHFGEDAARRMVFADVFVRGVPRLGAQP
jgi:hypothetical protein